MGKIFLQLVCDECNQIILEKEGEKNLSYEKFPITQEEALELDKKHRGHECHIEAVEKDQWFGFYNIKQNLKFKPLNQEEGV